MTPTAPIAEFAGIRYCTNLEGPGDPRWTGPPDRDRALRARRITHTDSSGKQYFWDHGTLVGLQSPASYRRLNEILGQG